MESGVAILIGGLSVGAKFQQVPNIFEVAPLAFQVEEGVALLVADTRLGTVTEKDGFYPGLPRIVAPLIAWNIKKRFLELGLGKTKNIGCKVGKNDSIVKSVRRK